MKFKPLRPVHVLPALLVIPPTLLGQNAYSQPQTAPVPPTSITPDQQAKQQTQELLGYVQKQIESSIRAHQKAEMPMTTRALWLQESAYKEAITEALNESIKSPLTPEQIRAIKSSLDQVIRIPLQNVSAQASPPSAGDEAIESFNERLIALWPSQGKIVTKEMALWQLRILLELALMPPMSPDEKAQLRQQIADFAPQIEAKFLEIAPDFSKARLTTLSREYTKQFQSALNPPSMVRLRPIAIEQVPGILEKSKAMALEVLHQPTQQTNSKTKDSLAEQAYAVFWLQLQMEMMASPSPQLKAMFPKDLSQRQSEYMRKLHDSQNDMELMQLRMQVLSTETQDSEVMVWLMRAGLEQHVGNYRAQLTLPLPAPPMDEYYVEHYPTKHIIPTHQAIVQLHFKKNSPTQLYLKVDSRKGVGEDFDFFMYRVGMVLQLDGRQLTANVPTYRSHQTLSIDRSYNRETIGIGDMRMGIPCIDPYLKDILTLQNTDWTHAKQTGIRTLNGVKCAVKEVRFARPLKVEEPHYLAGARRIIDSRKGIVLRQEEFDTKGQVVSTTTYDQFRAVQGAPSVPLHSRTIIIPGRAHFTLHQKDVTTKKVNSISGKVHFEGRTITRDYQLGKSNIPRISRLVVSDASGRRLMTLTFTPS